MLEVLLPLLVVPIWTQIFLNIKTAGNRVILQVCAEFRKPNMSNIMGLTKPIIHYCQFVWCCKANNKTNSPRLETKKNKLCSHSFKCSNYKGEHQADSTDCLFWKYRFNKEWHAKEYAKIQDNWKQSICSAVNGNKIWFLRI